MIRNLKALGLAFVAVLALGAVAASAATAHTPPKFHADQKQVIVTGHSEEDSLFTAAESTITCKKATFEGTVTGEETKGPPVTWTTEDITVSAAYSECTVFILGLNIPTKVDMGACAYTFHASGTVDVVNNPHVKHAADEANRCAKTPITYKVPLLGSECVVKVGPQSNLEKVTYKGTTTAEKDVTVTSDVTGISGTATGAPCPKPGAFTDGAYTKGATTVTGFKDTGDLTTPLEHGTKAEDEVPIWVTHTVA